MQFRNVEEQWYLYDTVAVSSWCDSLAHPIPGWFSSFNDLGQSDEISFFNTRNKSIGLAYNNQESRDQVPFALTVDSVSVGFFAPSCSSMLGDLGQLTYPGRIDTLSSFWESELPQHTSAIFKVNQDERLKTNCGMLPACYGPVGSAMAQGDMSTQGGHNTSITIGGFGRSHLKYRWEFPDGIGIPRRATMSVSLRFVEWARTCFQHLWGPGNMQFRDVDGESEVVAYKPSMFFIQAMVMGRREVQQRGQYHA